MKKRILNLSLSAVFAVATLFGAVACDKLPKAGGETDGTIEPGTVITDETVRGDLLGTLSKTEVKGLSYSGSAGMKLTSADEAQEYRLVVEGGARLSETPQADAFVSFAYPDDTDMAHGYSVYFVRGDDLYAAAQAAEDDKADFGAFKKALKSEPIVLDREEAQGIPALITSPAALKLLRNVGTLFDGVVTKTEGGYSLSYDIFAGADTLLAGAEALLEGVEKDVNMTLTALFAHPFVSGTLTKLLDGITAKELYAFAEKFPGEIVAFLPEADNGSAQDYVNGLLRSGEFFETLSGGDEAWGDFRTLGEVPVGKLVELISGGETDLASLGLKDMVHTIRTTLKREIVSTVLSLFGMESEPSAETMELAVTLSFDEEKRLLGFAIEASAEADLDAGEKQPDGGTTPEDGQGDEVQSAAAEAEKGMHMRATVKLSAACMNSPELFDLKGCKYRTDSGTQTIE